MAANVGGSIIPTFWTHKDCSEAGLARNPNAEALFLDSMLTARAFENTCGILPTVSSLFLSTSANCYSDRLRKCRWSIWKWICRAVTSHSAICGTTDEVGWVCGGHVCC